MLELRLLHRGLCLGVFTATLEPNQLSAEGSWAYSFTTASGLDVEFTLSADFVERARQQYATLVLAA